MASKENQFKGLKTQKDMDTPRSQKEVDEDLKSPFVADPPNNTDATDQKPDEQKKDHGRIWIAWAFAAAILFTLCNEAIAEITQAVGPLCFFYFSLGGLLASVIYHLLMSCKNLSNNGVFWNNQNLVVDHKLQRTHVVGFVAYCALYFLLQNMAFLTMYFAARADVNAGIITTLWSLNPLYMAFCDYLFFGTKLRYFHHLGTFAIIISIVLISLNGVMQPSVPGQPPTTAGPPPITEDNPYYDLFSFTVPAFVPVLFGVVTPTCFTANGMMTKHMAQQGFNASTLSYSAYFVVNLLVLVAGIIFWNLEVFTQKLFWSGLIGSFINTIGIVCIQEAISKGPAGPATAIAALSNLFLVIIEAIKMQKMLSLFEILGFVFGAFGATIIVIPKVYEMVFCFCCLDKFREKKPEDENKDQNQELKASAMSTNKTITGNPME